MKHIEIRQLIDDLVPTDGVHETGIEGVTVFRISRPLSRSPGVYAAGVCVLISGSKKVYLDNKVYLYDANNYLCCTVPMPVEAEISHASEKEPLLGMYIAFKPKVLSELAIEFEAAYSLERNLASESQVSHINVVSKDEAFNDAILKLLQLTQDKNALSILAKGRMREVYYAILKGCASQVVRQTFGVGDKIAKSIQYVYENLGEPITVEQMAHRAAMSRAVFHKKFKSATSLSPLQFVKNLKLNFAAKNIASGMTVSEAAIHSGYVSASQFSREFKRQFEKMPSEWREKPFRLDR